MTFSTFPSDPLAHNDDADDDLTAVAAAVTVPQSEYDRLEAMLLGRAPVAPQATEASAAAAASATSTTTSTTTATTVDEPSVDSSVPVPLQARFRALFTLKSLKSNAAVDVIAKAFSDPSALLKHELAYVLGQMKNPHAIPVLVAVLCDRSEVPMVRHEAAEALGAIGDPACLPVLEVFAAKEATAAAAADSGEQVPEVVRETCELAVAKIRHEMAEAERLEKMKLAAEDAKAKAAKISAASTQLFTSIDPAPPFENADSLSTEALGAILMDKSLSLFERYRAMFTLRNRGDTESVLELAKGLDDESALFRHEIAYVFGQMQHPASVPPLITALSKQHEEGMVRHECAEALGSIATTDCLPVLQKFAEDSEQVVRESCVVGLDIFDFEASGGFQYAESLRT
ncbi:armadillo-type protein [Zopfochytrium polystomum]|nr:armadillo-type protein [Zopfochytrium polystomum]